MPDSEQQVRLFVALSVPLEAKQQIASLPAVRLDFQRRTHPDDFHLTLRFIGDLVPAKVFEVIRCLSEFPKPSPFTVDVGGLGSFRQKDGYVLYAAINSVKKTSFLADRITRKLETIGLSWEPRPYVPHITIAKLKTANNLEEYIRRFGSSLRCQWIASEFCLVKSANASQDEKRYTVLERFSLS